MNYSEKMIAIPEKDFTKYIENALKLAKLGTFNDNLNLIVDKKVIEDTNIIDYIINKPDLKYKKEFDEIVAEIYTNKSPIDYKVNKNKSNLWIKY